jgi:integrase
MLPDGKIVGYSLTVRGQYLAVKFPSPTEDGKHVEKSTGATNMTDAQQEARKIIVEAYTPTLPEPAKTVDWKTVTEELSQSPGLRHATIKDQLSTLSVLRSILPESEGPSDITPEQATRFKRLYSQQPFKRGKDQKSKDGQVKEAKGFTRSANTVRAILRKLSALWNKHFKELGYIKVNVWDAVNPPPQTKKKPLVPTDEVIEHFNQWVSTRYPDWKMLRLFVDTKAHTACRTLDLCQLRSNQLREGRLCFEANQTKGRADRSIRLPENLYRSLEAIKGKVYLWESYVDDVARFRPVRSGNPSTFDPSNLYWTISNIFKEYNEQYPDRARLTPHAFRRRAITLMTELSGSSDAAASAAGVDPQTARKHYLDAKQAFNNDELFKRLDQRLNEKNPQNKTDEK